MLACIPCRRRKARCNLGSVDDPHDPPCQRCRRESKECFFSASRRKRTDNVAPLKNGESPSAFAVETNGVRFGNDVAPPADHTPRHASTNAESAHRSRTTGEFTRLTIPLKRPRPRDHDANNTDSDDLTTGSNLTTLLQRRETFNGHDAISLLCDAAMHTDRTSHAGEYVGMPEGSTNSQITRSESRRSQPRQKPLPSRDPHVLDGPGRPKHRKIRPHEPALSKFSSDDLHIGIKIWTRSRFVRSRSFTAMEAIEYIDYFYLNLCPLTPVTVPSYHNPCTHGELLKHEPMLAVTILTIASRYVHLKGPAATSRGYAIHQMLWQTLRGMIDEVIWGNEPLVGHAAGRSFDSTAGRGKGYRTLGTVEALLLLTEWHPRTENLATEPPAMDLLVPEDDVVQDDRRCLFIPPPNWVEAVWRSDRVCWSLLGNAQALAYELGVFDRVADTSSHLLSHLVAVPATHRRSENVRRLLYVYASQTSGRLTLPSMLSDSHCRDLFEFDPVARAATQLDQSLTAGNTAQLYRFPQHVELIQDAVLYFWTTVAGLMKRANRELFATRELTRHIISSELHVDLIEGLMSAANNWKIEFDACMTSKSALARQLRKIGN